jgi:Protein of unknown function (DUF3237)
MTPFGAAPVFRLSVDVEPPYALDPAAMGPVRLVRITGGSIAGDIAGRIVPGGTDWQTVTPQGLTLIEAHYLLELDDGTRVELQSRGQRAPDAAKFWSPIWLRTTAAAHAALNLHQYLGLGHKQGRQVIIDVYQLPAQ